MNTFSHYLVSLSLLVAYLLTFSLPLCFAYSQAWPHGN